MGNSVHLYLGDCNKNENKPSVDTITYMNNIQI